MQDERRGKGSFYKMKTLAKANLCRMKKWARELSENEALAKANLCRMRKLAMQAFIK